jgi:MFS family permease
MMMVAETQSVPGPSSYSMLLIHVFATTMTTSNYLPTFALEIVQDLHQPAHMVAWLYATMTFSSIVGMALMPRWLERFETRFILTTLSTLRFSSGLLHVIAISVASFPFQMPLLFGRLFLHGISLGTTVVANTWIAIRVPPTEVPRAIAMVTAASTLGVAFGPLLGNLFAAVEPSLSADDAAAGWSTATTSLMLMLITALYFEKGNLVKVSKDKDGKIKKEILTKKWHDWIDYWAVDFDYESRKEIIKRAKGFGEKGEKDVYTPEDGYFVDTEEVWSGNYIFENEWQSFRTKKDRELELTSASHTYEKKGRYIIAVKVVDIFGNDTRTLVPISIL